MTLYDVVHAMPTLKLCFSLKGEREREGEKLYVCDTKSASSAINRFNVQINTVNYDLYLCNVQKKEEEEVNAQQFLSFR